MTRFRLLAWFAALLAVSDLRAQRGLPPVAADSVCADWRRTLRERGPFPMFLRPDRTASCAPDDSTIDEHWRTAKADAGELASLWSVTGLVGGARPLRAVLRRLTDARSPTLVRLAALAVLPMYLDPTRVCRVPQLDTLWTPDSGCRIENASFRASSSIEPILRDSIRARVHDVASESGAVGRAANALMAQWPKLERWSETHAAWCRRTGAAFGPALRMNASALASSEFRELAECTESGPAAVAIAWREGRLNDPKVRLSFVRLTAGVRDRRVYSALLAVARDPARTTDDRVAAIDAMGTLLHPALVWWTTADRRANPQSSCPPFGSGFWEAVQEEGGDPMGPGSRRTGAEELGRLAGENVPPPVSDAARVVAGCARELLRTHLPQK
jgi:hypothetical protein